MIGGYYSHAAAVTPSDTININPPCYAFVVGTSGNVKFNVFGANSQTGGYASVGSSEIPYGISGPQAQIGPAPTDATAVTLYCIAGFIYPVRCSRFYATVSGTAATGIVALW